MCGNLRKLQWRRQFTYLNGKWRFVRILENRALPAGPPRISEFWSTSINIFSAPFSNLLHKARIQDHLEIFSKDQKAQCRTIAEGKRKTLAGGAARVSELRRTVAGYCNASIRRVMVR